jgi:hypothetical protein
LVADGASFTGGSTNLIVNSGGQASFANTRLEGRVTFNTGSAGSVGCSHLHNITIHSNADVEFYNNDLSSASVSAVGTSGSVIHMEYNWWGTTSTATINTKIQDWNDNHNLPLVEYTPFLSSPPSTGCVIAADRASLRGLAVEADSLGQVLGPLAGASVSFAGIATTTNQQGEFEFTGLPPNSGTVTISKTGYYSATRTITIAAGEAKYETFQLQANSGLGSPATLDFDSPNGHHLIEGMPGNLAFETTVAWNGSPGSVQCTVAGTQHQAVITNLGGGLARATLDISAPSAVDTCSEIMVEVVNGEGRRTFFKTGVHVSPVPGIIVPWYQDNIPWTPDSLKLDFSLEKSHDWKLPLGSNDLKLEASLGYNAGLSYDLLGATFGGSLGGFGGLDIEWNLPGTPVEILGEAQLGLAGELDIALAGCDAPELTPSWEASFSGKAGVGAKAVAVVGVLFPPAAPAVNFLLTIPVVKEVVGALKVRVYLIGGATVSGEYELGTWNDACFLGADTINVSGTMGIEAQALLKLDEDVKVGIYAGGTGTPEFEVCPEWVFRSLTLAAYVGVFAHAWLFQFTEEVGTEICFGDCTEERALGSVALGDPMLNGKWRPLGFELVRWGEANQTGRDQILLWRGTNQAEGLGPALEEILVTNVSPLASPSLISDSTQTHVAYALHDPSKPWYQATDIASVRSVGGAAWTMERVADDAMADFGPVLAATSVDKDIAVWEQIDGDVSGAQSPSDVAPYLEIATSFFDRATGEWTTPILVANNDVVDRAPCPVVYNGTTGVIWIQNEADASPGNSSSGDRLMFAHWNGTNWSSPEIVWSGQKGVLGLAFVEDSGGAGYVVFTVDEDGNLDTRDDRELYALETAGGIWQATRRLTNDTVEDALPVLVAPNGEVICVWASDGTVMYSPLGTWNARPIYAEDTLANQAPSLDGVTMPGGAAVAYGVQGPEGVDIVAAFYDVEVDQWSLPRQLTQDEHSETALSLAYNGSQLLIAYLKTQTERNDMDIEISGQLHHLTNVPQPGRTDLCLLRHVLGNDLAVVERSLVVEPPNPVPGSPATIKATIENRGDLPVVGALVELYDGDPNNGGASIAKVSVSPSPLMAGRTEQLLFPWNVPSLQVPHRLFVVVDPDLNVDDRDRSNNTVSAWIVLPNIEMASGPITRVSETAVAVTTRLMNSGSVPTGPFGVSWRLNAADGAEIGVGTTDPVPSGGSYDATFVWDTRDLRPGDFVQVFALANFDHSVNEADETDNVHVQVVHVPLILGDLDRDRDIDAQDHAVGSACLTGPGVTMPESCRESDLESDGDVDLKDFAVFQRVFTGVLP